MSKEEYGHRLKEFRKYIKKTQGELGDNTNLSSSNIARIERGEIFPNFEYLANLHSKYNLNIHWLITGAGDMQFSDSTDSGIKKGCSLKQLFPELPDDPKIEQMLECMQIDIFYHAMIVEYLNKRKDYNSFVEEYYESKDYRSVKNG